MVEPAGKWSGLDALEAALTNQRKAKLGDMFDAVQSTRGGLDEGTFYSINKAWHEVRTLFF